MNKLPFFVLLGVIILLSGCSHPATVPTETTTTTEAPTPVEQIKEPQKRK